MPIIFMFDGIFPGEWVPTPPWLVKPKQDERLWRRLGTNDGGPVGLGRIEGWWGENRRDEKAKGVDGRCGGVPHPSSSRSDLSLSLLSLTHFVF